MGQINPDLPEVGSDVDIWGNILNTAFGQLIAQGNQNDSAYTAIRSVKFYGAEGDGVTDDSAAIAAALADNHGRTLFFPVGTYRVASATRLVLAGNSSSIVGDPSGLGSVIKFENPAGGLDIGDGAGLTYENRLVAITIVGSGVTTTTVRCRKMYEPYFNQVRIENGSTAVGACHLELNDCGQLDANRLVIQGSKTAIKITGALPVLVATLRLSNFFNCENAVLIATGMGGGIPKFHLEDSWIESVPNIVTIDVGANSLSVGELSFSNVRYLQAAGNFRLVKTVSHGAVYFTRLRFEESNVEAVASTVPLVDFSAVANPGIVWVQLREMDLNIGGTEPLIKANAAQEWWLFHTKIDDIRHPATGLFDPGRWSGAPYAIGGTFPEPYSLVAVGSPEGSLAAPPGSQARRIDGGDNSLYVKTAGSGNTGWKAATLV